MNSASFLEEFGHIANAPNGVVRLRALVLQLAATGRLIVSAEPQDSAEALVSKLAEEREKLIASGAAKATSPLPPVDLSNPLPDVPTHWRWTRLGNLTSKIGSGSTPRGGSQVYVSKGVPFLRSQNIWNDGIHLDDVVNIDPETHQGMRNTQVLPMDILLNITGASLGRCASVPSDFPSANVSQHVTIIRPLLADIRHFIRICLLSPFGQEMIWGRQVGMAREGLSKKVLEQFEIPLPPLSEQKRIVAKADELMALCDQLELHQQERERRFPLLSRTCHAQFAEFPTPSNLNRIFEETGTVSPADVRKTILMLAVQGKLLPQALDDEPVELSLARSDSHRQQVARKDRRADDENQSLLSLEDCWNIVDSWEWRGLADLVLFVDYRGKTPTKISEGVRLLTAKNVRKGEINLSPEEFLSEADYQKWMTRGFPKPGDVLFTTEAPMGNAAEVQLTERFALAQRVICFQSYGAVEPSFLVMQILSDGFQRILDKNGTGVTAKGIKASKLKRLPIAVPPLAEQRRIVAKVNELMALVDQLEAQQQEKDRMAEAFAKACVASFTGTTQIERPDKMKVPKTELVSLVTLGKMPKPDARAPLAQLLIHNNGTLGAKSLWQQSDYNKDISAFYRQLKAELAQGWIALPAEAEMKVVEDNPRRGGTTAQRLLSE
jgi:type I restriction enzyme S subunit